MFTEDNRDALMQQAKDDYLALMLENKRRGKVTKKQEKELADVGIFLSPEKIETDVQREWERGRQKEHKYVKEERREILAQSKQKISVHKSYMYREINEYEIRDNEWRPLDVVNHEQDFVDWINSMTFGIFPDMIFYEKYEKYKAQAMYWFETFENPYDYDDQEKRTDIIMNEYNRIDRNTLYFAMQYAWIPEGSVREGKIKYIPKEQNAVIFYMLDCGYLFILGKPRQIFATTTVGIFINKKLITQENFFMVLITENEETAKGILNDKIKAPFRYYHNYLRPTVDRDYIKGFKLSGAKKKGEAGYPNSRIEVVAPNKTAINSGAPQIVLIDEAASTPDLIPIILEQRPTLYMDLNQDGKLQIKRQLCIWSTGTSSEKGKMAYHSLFTNTLKLWEEGNYKAALFVPLFFSWHTRCGQEEYEAAKISYFSGDAADAQGYGAEERKQIFGMHYPSTWMDMFAMVTKKLVPTEIITEAQSRIRKLSKLERPVFGRFEPIYDLQQPADEKITGCAYKVIGARFVPYDDSDNDPTRITTIMRFKPELWENRYFQGTDPIETDTGQSQFNSTIWDKERKTVPCVVNFRPPYDQKEAFLQAVLMSIYYDPNPIGNKKGVPEVIENNIGTLYKTHKELLGYDNNIIYNKELPEELQGGGSNWGMNSKQKRKEVSVGLLKECITSYSENIDIDLYFKQLETYIPIQVSGGYTYGPADKRLYRDDALDGLAFAYIASKTCDKAPLELGKKDDTKKKLVTVQKRDAFGNLYFAQEYK